MSIVPSRFDRYVPEYTQELGQRLNKLSDSQVVDVAKRYCLAVGIDPNAETSRCPTHAPLLRLIERRSGNVAHAVYVVAQILLDWRARYRADRSLHAAIDAVTGDE